VGLIAREIEAAGIPTVSISIVREYSEKVRPPRTVFLRWPFGHPLGESFKREQHLAVLEKAFQALTDVREPGAIVDLPFKWRREKYELPHWLSAGSERTG
jgi:hypothetical protein